MPLEWNLQLADKQFTGPANNAANALVNLTQKLEGARSACVTFGKDGSVSFKAVAEQAEAASQKGLSFGHAVTAAMAMVVTATYKGIKALDEFGSHAVEAFGERAGTLRTWTALLGDAQQAQDEFMRTQRHALNTPFLSSILETTKTQLMGQDLRNEGGRPGGQLDKVMLALEDLAARHHDRNQALSRGTYAVDEILSQGHLSALRARQLSIDLMLPQRRMAEALGMTGEQFHGALHSKSIDNEKFLYMLQRAAVLHTKESKLGETSTMSAGSLSTLLVNQGEQLKNLLKTFNAEEHIPGVQRYKDALADQAKSYDVATARGQALVLTVQGLSETSTEMKASWTDFVTGFTDSFAQAYNQVTAELGLGTEQWNKTSAAARELGATVGGEAGAAVANLTHSLREMAPALELADTMITGFSTIIKSFAYTVQFAWNLFDSIDWKSPKTVSGSWRKFADQEDRLWNPERYPRQKPDEGVNIIDVSNGGEYSPTGNWVMQGAEDGEDYIRGLRQGTKTHSPSQEMREFAKDLQDGFNLGMQDSQAAGPAAVPAGTIHLTQNISGAGDPEAVAKLTWEMFAVEFGRLPRA